MLSRSAEGTAAGYRGDRRWQRVCERYFLGGVGRGDSDRYGDLRGQQLRSLMRRGDIYRVSRDLDPVGPVEIRGGQGRLLAAGRCSPEGRIQPDVQQRARSVTSAAGRRASTGGVGRWLSRLGYLVPPGASLSWPAQTRGG